MMYEYDVTKRLRYTLIILEIALRVSKLSETDISPELTSTSAPNR
jgi:hypothetical protein